MPSWLVESYWPTSAPAPEIAADRLRALARPGVHLIGVVHVPGDEMALWRLSAADRNAAEAACLAADIPFERIVEIVDIREDDPEHGPETTRSASHPPTPIDTEAPFHA